jgi:glycosyltransferase involved in cell wall biosynthesis
MKNSRVAMFFFLLVSNHVMCSPRGMQPRVCVKKSIHVDQSIENWLDLTLVGYACMADGLGQKGVHLIDLLKDDLDIGFVCTRPKVTSYSGISHSVKEVLMKKSVEPSKVVLFYDSISNKLGNFYNKVPEGHIKIAWSVFEASRIPNSWVHVLNEKFDAVVVPDEHLIETYQCSGVNIPIFVIPEGADLSRFITKRSHLRAIKPLRPFIFGCSAVFSPHKNIDTLILAFKKAFGDTEEVRLCIHGRGANPSYFDVIKKHVSDCKNIHILRRNLTNEEYISFLELLHCYVLVSKGEGFSISPREALACGVPCIISNNSAHKTLCKSGFVRSVRSDIAEPAHFPIYHSFNAHVYGCSVDEVKQALLDVYAHYSTYVDMAQSSHSWVMQYDWKRLKDLWLTLVKPQRVRLGDKNICSNNCLETNSEGLYKKYLTLIGCRK